MYIKMFWQIIAYLAIFNKLLFIYFSGGHQQWTVKWYGKRVKLKQDGQFINMVVRTNNKCEYKRSNFIYIHIYVTTTPLW